MAKKAKKTTKKASKKAMKKVAKKATQKKTMKAKGTAKKAVKTKAKKKVTKKTAPKIKAGASDNTASTIDSAALSLIGQVIPNFEVSSTSGTVSLDGLRGKKVVLYFYPKDSTPGCTIEGHEFSKLLPEFEREGAVVYGISRDSMDSHNKFKTKECFDVELLSDEDENLCRMFDVIKEKNMYGKKVMGIERSTFVIDHEGKVAAEWRKVTAQGHAQEVLNKVKGIV